MLLRTFLTRFSIYRPVIIDPADLDWKQIKGGGPGGQNVNKTNSCVQLTHRPTGIVVKCQRSRDVETNKNFAFKILKDQLDQMQNGEFSKKAQQIQKAQRQKAKRQSRSSRKYDNTSNNDSKQNQNDDETE